MPPLIATVGAHNPITPEALIDALDAARVDPRDEAGFAALAPLLARLGANRRFLADRAVAELKSRHAGQRANGYGAQVLLLHPPTGHYVLRANFWPAAGDAVLRASGPAPFFYDFPHDHNFPFLTLGYLGPGYWSDYYERADRGGAAGDPAGLAFTGRARLAPGEVRHYRAHRDIHRQLPPDAFSVSINILGYHPAQPWRDQLRFDLERNRIAGTLTTTPSEVLVALAVQLGGGNGIDLASDFAQRHPHPRMRRTALQALRSAGLGD